MNKETGLFAAGTISTIYSWVGPATEILQFVAVLLGVIATSCAIILYIKRIKNYDSTDTKDSDN